MNEETGNILDKQSGTIVQQVNCQHVDNAGLAAQIKKKYPIVHEKYMEDSPQMGKVLYVEVIPKTLYVACIYGQENYGGGGQYTNLGALSRGLADVYGRGPKPLWVPYGIGCGMGGGNWDDVKDLLTFWCGNATIVKLPGQQL